MPNFQYKAYDKNGNPKNGIVEATDQESAINLLRNLGLTVTSLEVEVKSTLNTNLSIGKKVKTKEIVVFSRQLATMINAGLPLVRALRILQDQSANKEFQKILDKIASDVEAGTSLSQALSKYPKTFNKVYVTMIRSGEASGRLDEVLLRISDQQEKDFNMMSKIKSAMAYPAFILVMLVGVVVLMMVMVVPQLKIIFEQSNVQLPLPTRILLAISNFTTHYWWLLIIIIISVVFGFRFWISTPSGRRAWDAAKLKIPVFGKLAELIYMTRFTRTLGTLVTGGLPILEALDITADAIGNTLYRDAIQDTAKKVEAGVGIGTTLRKKKIFPVMVSQMIEVGEKTGNIDQILDRLSQFYENETDTMIKTMSSLLEPILMIIMGIGVGFLAIAIIMPIYGLVQVI